MALEEIGAGWLVCTLSRCPPLKGTEILGGPLILVMPVLELHIDLDQLEDEARS